jgi:uncharacterized protein
MAGDEMMELLPTLELLEKTHQFPGPYMFKAIGRAEDGFVSRVVAAVRAELAQDEDPPYSFREARGGRHVAVTLEPTVQTPQQVLAIYRQIRAIAGLVMLL